MQKLISRLCKIIYTNLIGPIKRSRELRGCRAGTVRERLQRPGPRTPRADVRGPGRWPRVRSDTLSHRRGLPSARRKMLVFRENPSAVDSELPGLSLPGESAFLSGVACPRGCGAVPSPCALWGGESSPRPTGARWRVPTATAGTLRDFQAPAESPPTHFFFFFNLSIYFQSVADSKPREPVPPQGNAWDNCSFCHSHCYDSRDVRVDINK